MIMRTNNNDSELAYYLKIIEFFQNQTQDPESIELWKNKSLIELMKVLKRTKNKLLVRNALLIIISLFEHLPPDLFNNKGINANLLNKEEKATLKSILRNEIVDDLSN
jgi:hypothetical protein